MTEYFPARVFHKYGEVDEGWGEYCFIGIVELIVPHTLGWGTPLGYATYTKLEDSYVPVTLFRTSYEDCLLTSTKPMKEFAEKAASETGKIDPAKFKRKLPVKDIKTPESYIRLRPLTRRQMKHFEATVLEALAGK